MMLARVCVCTPSKRANRGSSLYWGGWGQKRKKKKKRRGHPVTFLLKDGGELYERRQDVDRARGWYLVIQHEQEGAFDVDVAGPFYLETIRLLSGGHSVPLKDQMKKYDKLKYVTYKLSKTRTGRYLFYLINHIMALLYFILSSKKASCWHNATPNTPILWHNVNYFDI